MTCNALWLPASEGRALMVDSDSVVVAGAGEPLAEMGVAPSANVQAVAQ